MAIFRTDPEQRSACRRRARHRSIALILLLLLLFLRSPTSAGTVIPRDTWPESWFHDPKTASQLGITAFRQSPMLDEVVKRGELPPVEERLPEDPIVVEPLERIGQYGGTAVVFAMDEIGDGGILDASNMLLLMDPEVSGIRANLAKDWEFRDGGKTLVLYLRRGVKWSDGHPYTADDFMFWYEHMLKNKDLTPVVARMWKAGGRLIEVVKIDDYTVEFRSGAPMPYLVNSLAQSLPPSNFTPPSHHLKRFHPDFVPKDVLMKEAKKFGFDIWTQYFEHMRSLDPQVNCPTTGPYRVTELTSTMLIAERNPYYTKIDPAGNQLPYIDKIEVHYVQSEEMITAKAATGQATVAGFFTKTSDIPLFKLLEERGNFKTLIWRLLYGVDVLIQFNFNCANEELRRIFWDIRFRKALSLAINREEINQIIYFGRGVPRQTTVIPTSKFFEEKFARAYTEYDPHRARELLDEMGVVDRNGDGVRDCPNGKPLNITLEWTPMGTPKGLTMELVVDHWRDVGVDVNLKQNSASLQIARATGGLMEMTLWHGDRTTDILFPPAPFWFVPTSVGWEKCMWNQWAMWNTSDGAKGEEPPDEIKQLIDWWNEMRTCMDEQKRIELGKRILQSQAENLWTIGTVGLAPHPLIVSSKLRNVPRTGYWGWDCRYSMPYHPETWYLARE